MKKEMNDVMNIMNSINYGFLVNSDDISCGDKFSELYHLLSPKELLDVKYGVCWDQVELERYLFNERGISVCTYFIVSCDNKNNPTHTFLVMEDNNKYFWFEHSWEKYCGIHEFDSFNELIDDVRVKFIEDNSNGKIKLFKYELPKFGIKCEEFYNFCCSGEEIEFPFYFYHLVNKNADLTKGLISLRYMYNNKMYDLFDKNSEKYKNRIINDWNISKYKGKTNITREEILDGLNIFRGNNGDNCIYFFKYYPYKKLGPNMENILKYKDIYRIDLNDSNTKRYIDNIDYGFYMSNSDNYRLNKNYYLNVSKGDYFSKYNDSSKMNFANLNHISIQFKNGICPIELLKKINDE